MSATEPEALLPFGLFEQPPASPEAPKAQPAPARKARKTRGPRRNPVGTAPVGAAPVAATSVKAKPAAKPRRKAKARRASASVAPKGVTTPLTAPAVAPVPPPAKRPRAARGTTARSGNSRLDLGAVVTAMSGLRPPDATLFNQIVQVLQRQGKASRIRIVDAIKKLFT